MAGDRHAGQFEAVEPKREWVDRDSAMTEPDTGDVADDDVVEPRLLVVVMPPEQGRRASERAVVLVRVRPGGVAVREPHADRTLDEVSSGGPESRHAFPPVARQRIDDDAARRRPDTPIPRCGKPYAVENSGRVEAWIVRGERRDRKRGPELLRVEQCALEARPMVVHREIRRERQKPAVGAAPDRLAGYRVDVTEGAEVHAPHPRAYRAARAIRSAAPPRALRALAAFGREPFQDTQQGVG